MRIYKLIPAMIVAFILQLSVVNGISFFGVSPSVILVLEMITIFLFSDEIRCVIASVVVGFCLDATVGSYMGVYGLTLFLVALFAVFYKGICNNENKLSLIPLTFIGTIIYNVVPVAFYAMAGMSVNIERVVKFTVIGFILNLILMYIMYLFMIKKASYRPKRSQYERYETI